MKLFNKITIVGVGLLGASIGMAVKKKHIASKVTGYFRDKRKIADAKKMGAIDEGTDDFIQAIKGSDFIILCSPVGDIIRKLQALKQLGELDVLITDIGSTKTEIAKAGRGLNFIGSHPLAGSEKSGAPYAHADLLKNSICIVSLEEKQSRRGAARIKQFWKSLGAHVVALKPQTHDRILGFVSHLPHAVAFSLMDAVPKENLRFSAGGLKDTTRIALSNPDLWIDIFSSNKNELLKSIDAFEKSIRHFKKALSGNDQTALYSLLARARKKRKSIPPNHDVF